ncbi:T9SS type A sorting domain-containing protein [Aquimarina agarivorans]|uniref:T9SS type A sorting domain-containing protein n=1 Tax=Aquimarina agarivorans TaxID=980584 RepID=UPI000B9B24F4|nr:T9SS type A sorting domain-containing protein [Aquimarina agarivorans]
MLFVELGTTNTNKEKTFYQIFDAQSKQIQSGSIKADGTIDVSSLAPELYFLIIIDSASIRKIKFLKK